jgi:hypothetical protein
MINRLYAGYVAKRTPSWKKQIGAILKIKVNTHALYLGMK